VDVTSPLFALELDENQDELLVENAFLTIKESAISIGKPYPITIKENPP
jgi:hypothetical protein|tara:strand:+ start:162 stop:308 length:147 start_codon:yes stop_codon:yes gene_type:complete